MSSELACQFCTFTNEQGARICNACGHSLGLPPVNLNPSGIECVECTFQNPYDSANCAMCGTKIVKQETVDLSMTETGQLCQICFCTISNEFKMPGCTHIFCISCAKQHFTIKINECGIKNFRCPIDVCSSFDELADKSDFFRDLKRALHSILDEKTREVYASKVFILDIMDKPGFVRCSSCNKGFISLTVTEDATYPTKKATCECGYTFCSKCGRKWSNIHSKENCKPKQNGMDDNEDWQMNTNATCPQCKYKYYLERGGCMHITCSQCSYEYCEFCFKEITGKRKSCNFPNCTKGQSLHGHHPRNCMYYVQEMKHKKLEQLLKTNGVRYNLVQGPRIATCPVKINRSVGATWIDSLCGKLSQKSWNNMCVQHYKWHLGELLRKHNIDTVDAMNNLECICELKRNNVVLPAIRANYNQPMEDQDTLILRNLVRTKIPHCEI